MLLLLAVGGGGAYKFVLAAQAGEGGAARRSRARSFPLSPEFVVNLDGGHYGKVTVALLLTRRRPGRVRGRRRRRRCRRTRSSARSSPNDLTGLAVERPDRPPDSATTLEQKILTDLQKTTDVKVTEVLFTDVVVQ